MRYPPLEISVKRVTWRLADLESPQADEAFRRARQRVLVRDGHRCRFCGFKAQKWQEVHHVNGDHHDNRLQNLVTVCHLCHSIFHIGLAGLNGEMVLIYAPEFVQQDLHHLARASWVAQHVGGAFAEAARALDEAMLERAAVVEERLGTCDPALLGSCLLELPEAEATRAIRERLEGLRAWPIGRQIVDARDRLPDIIDYWVRSGPYRGLEPRTWRRLLVEARKRLGRPAGRKPSRKEQEREGGDRG